MLVKFIDTKFNELFQEMLDRTPCIGETVNIGLVFYTVVEVATSFDPLFKYLGTTVVLKQKR